MAGGFVVAGLVVAEQILPDHAGALGVAEHGHGGRVGVHHAAPAVQHQRAGAAPEQFAVAGLGGVHRLLGRHFVRQAKALIEGKKPAENGKPE
mgnify:CR=1 FL=1